MFAMKLYIDVVQMVIIRKSWKIRAVPVISQALGGCQCYCMCARYLSWSYRQHYQWEGNLIRFFFWGGDFFFFGPGSWCLLWLLWLLVAPGGFCGFCGFYGSWLLELLAPMAHLSSIDQSISEACSPGVCCALDTP